MNCIPESDWKLLRQMEPEKLALACERILSRAALITQNRKGKEHEAFLKLWREVNDGNKEIANMFDDIRRSTAIFKLLAWRTNGLLSDEELSKFSPPTREFLERFQNLR
ncbi:MAG: hypothetical protein WC071_14035 [Victivallaceae bacterium]